MTLFDPFRLGRIDLANRVVMAPMTRSRSIGGVPGVLVRDYYAQRASAGLVVTEGIAPTPDGLGYARIPGLYAPEQTAAWADVTRAVHAAGGRIFAQLMHTGRIAHPLNQPAGARVLAPSAVRAEESMYTDEAGPQPLPEPLAMTAEDLAEARRGFVRAARNAIDAGFDGVELHGANGYLLEQFLHPHSNRRTDAYGGSPERRARFVAEVVSETAEAIGADRVGIRLSPFSPFNDLPAHGEVLEGYTALAGSLRGLAYVHLIMSKDPGFREVARAVRRLHGGPTILNGGFDADRARAAIADGDADLVSFGRPFIANPDLVDRMRRGLPLASADPSTFYTPGPAGYVDYVAASAAA